MPARKAGSRASGRNQAGISLVEVLVASTILAMVMTVILRSTTLSTNATEYAKTSSLLTVNSQTRMLLLRDDLSASVRLFQNNAEGQGYLARLQLGSLALVPGAALPALDTYGVFGKDAVGTPRAGNVLLFAKSALPFPTAAERNDWQAICDAESMPGRRTALDDVRIDVYRVIAYYPRWPGASPPNGEPAGLDLVRWVSRPLADRERFLEIDPAIQESVLMALARSELRGIQWLWTPGDPADSAFSEIQASWTLLPVAEGTHPAWRIPTDNEWTEESIFLKRKISLATVWAPPGQGVSRFAQAVLASPGFPHGFEVQMIGPASARQVLVHMNLVGRTTRGDATFVEAQELINCRDL